jgi:hypothetical protein
VVGRAGPRPDGLRDAGGGIGGFLPNGNGGFGFPPATEDPKVTILAGLYVSFKFAADRDGGTGAVPGGRGGAPGGLGAVPAGGLGAETREVSGSERYGLEFTAPVDTPPLFLSFGIPPANSPLN